MAKKKPQNALVPIEKQSSAFYAPPDANNDIVWQECLRTPMTSSESELLLARYLARKSKEDGLSANTTGSFLTLASKLVERVRQERKEDGQRIDKSEITQIVKRIVTLISSIMKERGVPDYESIIDELTERIDECEQ